MPAAVWSKRPRISAKPRVDLVELRADLGEPGAHLLEPGGGLHAQGVDGLTVGVDLDGEIGEVTVTGGGEVAGRGGVGDRGRGIGGDLLHAALHRGQSSKVGVIDDVDEGASLRASTTSAAGSVGQARACNQSRMRARTAGTASGAADTTVIRSSARTPRSGNSPGAAQSPPTIVMRASHLAGPLLDRRDRIMEPDGVRHIR